ncbi:major outer membrane protein [Legionella lansingensis]|uniref:Major outer membrane protein n=1 Tax=Legionella lansingensis TaxID=45067 RepID=A0A0W0VRF9_9GAMM|nr:Lpg1974 family pore-forming outer membrane protein [Legionella lansingensis]KTD22772.1 major outer membrane protein [Legionella lansingensis]SNV57098.1 major outer membrane protein [Legionella lansingensis]
MKKCLSAMFTSLCIASVASAGTTGEESICTSSLCAFDNPGGFYISGAALYVRPSETGIGLATDSWQYALPGGNVRSVSKPFDPEHEWEGSVTLGYDFPMTANHIEMSYLRLDNNTHVVNDTEDAPISFSSIFFPNILIPLTPGAILVSDTQLHYELNQVDLKVGRLYRDTAGNFNIRPSLGARYISLDHHQTFITSGNVISEYDGVGPLFSLEGRYGLSKGFGLVGYFDYALIVGQINAHSHVTVLGTDFSFTSPKRDRIVNNLTGKLGINYHYIFTNLSTLTLEAGYQVSEYINAMDMIRGDIGVRQKIAGLETTSFGFRGPYVSLSWHAYPA